MSSLPGVRLAVFACAKRIVFRSTNDIIGREEEFIAIPSEREECFW